MKVSELIIKLQSMPQDATVVVRGYENGYDCIKDVKTLLVQKNKSNNWWDGYFDNPEDDLNSSNINVVFIEQYDDEDKHGNSPQ